MLPMPVAPSRWRPQKPCRSPAWLRPGLFELIEQFLRLVGREFG